MTLNEFVAVTADYLIVLMFISAFFKAMKKGIDDTSNRPD